MTTRAAIYARVSTDEQAKGYSLSTQIDECKKYALEKGYEVVGVFQDDFTGASLDRPELNLLRDLVSSGAIQIVLVLDVDRLARKTVYQLLIEEEFLTQGVSIEFVLGQYANTDEGRLQKQIRGALAEYEKAKILERSKRGKRGKALAGYALVGNRPPYGYRVVSEPHKAWLEVDEEEAEIVRLVFELYTCGDGESGPLSIGGITRKLSAMAIPTRGDKVAHVAKKRGRGVWSSCMVRNILRNETYTGVWHFQKTKMSSDGKEASRKQVAKRGQGIQVPRDRKEWISVPVPSLIDREIFELVQAKLKTNKERAKRNTKHPYLMRGRLRCLRCGYTLQARKRNERNRYYYCKGTEQVPERLCRLPGFRVDLVDTVVWDWLKSLLQNPDHIADGLMGMQDEATRKHRSLFNRLDILSKQTEETQQQLDRLLDLYLAGDFPKNVLVERKARLEDLLIKQRKELGELQSMVKTINLTDRQIQDIKDFCAGISEGLDVVSFEEKRQIVELLDVRGKVAIEEDERIIYATCLIGQRRVSLALTSPLSNIGETKTRTSTSPPTHLFR